MSVSQLLIRCFLMAAMAGGLWIPSALGQRIQLPIQPGPLPNGKIQIQIRKQIGQQRIILQFGEGNFRRVPQKKLHIPNVPPPPPLPSRIAIPPTELELLITQLESGEFQDRMAATRSLKTRGSVGTVRQIVSATEYSSPELSMRALSILESIFLSSDDEANREAEQALEGFAQNPENVLSFSAEAILLDHAQLRTKRAIVDLQEMGLHIEYNMDILKIDDITGELYPSISFIRISRSWTGGEEGIKQIARLRGLGAVYVITTSPVSPEKVAEILFPLNPNAQIEVRSPAQLGIRGASITPELPGVMIHEVTPGKAAQLAGIRSNDVITHLEGKETTAFHQLTTLLKKFEPGDVIEVIVTRTSNPRAARVLNVKLQGW